jgi:predicted metal-dependent hydrolase
VLLNVPPKGSVTEAKRFLSSKTLWIREKTGEMPKHSCLEEFLAFQPAVWIDSCPRNLFFEFLESRNKTIHQVTTDLIEVSFPDNQDRENSILSFLIDLARVYLPIRLEVSSRKVGVSYSKVRVGNQKSRWGSCSSQRVISLNWRILLLDYEIGEYVLFHELAHLKHMNHSSNYWKLLNEWVPGARIVDRQLSQKGRELMLLGRL